MKYEPQLSIRFRIALCSFGLLALELALIRWMSGQIRLVAYFANLVLVASFLGIGLGIQLGKEKGWLHHLCLPFLAIFSFALAFSEELHLMHLRFPDLSLSLWGTETNSTEVFPFLLASFLLLAFFWSVTIVFALAATSLGSIFSKIDPLEAYTADLIGSICGVAAISLISASYSPPSTWLAIGSLAFLLLSWRWYTVIAFFFILLFAGLSEKGAHFSPYNRIDLTTYNLGKKGTPDEFSALSLSVNRDFHQDLLDLSNPKFSAPDSTRAYIQSVYELPFKARGKVETALIVGAGTGNDVAAALRSGTKAITAVEIDPVIFWLGEQYHPERPYSSPFVYRVNDDARAFLEKNQDRKFDVIDYGLLDSHSMFSAMSSLRLDNFVYTVEGVRAAWNHLKPDGLMAISFSIYAGTWMRDRMFEIVQKATGVTPIVVAHGYNFGATFIVGPNLGSISIPEPFRAKVIDMGNRKEIRAPTDDWPFLYLKPNTFPYGYFFVLTLIALSSWLAIQATFKKTRKAGDQFDYSLFFLGAAFMLVETRLVTSLSLLFGSTWIVNSCVFSGVLLMVLLANLYVMKFRPQKTAVWFFPLILALALNYIFPPSHLNGFSLLERAAISSLFYSLPVFFAGVIFSALLAKSKNPTFSLGSNLLGSVMGGILEYSSMIFGLKSVILIAIFFYLTAYTLVWKGSTKGK